MPEQNSPDPVVIAVAITGSVPRKRDNPAVPITPAEQIESTHEAFEAGATLAHIHVRNDDESSSSHPVRFQAVQEGIRRRCPGMIVQFSTGGRGREPAARSSSLPLKPDMASLPSAQPRSLFFSSRFLYLIGGHGAGFVAKTLAHISRYVGYLLVGQMRKRRHDAAVGFAIDFLAAHAL